MHREITRHIKKEVERELWARSAGRCQFLGCNRLLYKSPVTQEQVNIAETAHIYSFSKSGPRGWGPFSLDKLSLNLGGNLLLVCHDCHKTIDKDKDGTRYPAELLMGWKRQHEERIRVVTGISPDKTSHMVLYGARVGEELSPLDHLSAAEAVFPDWYPADERPVILSMSCEHEDRVPEYWSTEERHLRAAFDRQIVPRISADKSCHFSVFALAPQPLLVLLGSLLTDKIAAEVYQLHREPRTWRWQSHPQGFRFDVIEPRDYDHPPALVMSLSDRVAPERIMSVIGDDISIWEITVDDCHNDFLRSSAQLSMFRETLRKLMVRIKQMHGQSAPLSIFPAMPVSCAVELGRIRMPKADMPWIVFDQNNKLGKFEKAITISGGNDGQSAD